MKSKMETGKQKFYQTFVNVTFTFDFKLSVDEDLDESDVKYQVEEIFNDLIANGEVVVVDSDTAVVRGDISDVDVETDREITKEKFDAAPGKPNLHLGSYFKLN